MAELLRCAGETRSVEVLEDESTWSSYRQKIALFEAVEPLTGDPWVARRIGASVLTEQFGAILRVVVGALGSPQHVLRSVAPHERQVLDERHDGDDLLDLRSCGGELPVAR